MHALEASINWGCTDLGNGPALEILGVEWASFIVHRTMQCSRASFGITGPHVGRIKEPTAIGCRLLGLTTVPE